MQIALESLPNLTEVDIDWSKLELAAETMRLQLATSIHLLLAKPKNVCMKKREKLSHLRKP